MDEPKLSLGEWILGGAIFAYDWALSGLWVALADLLGVLFVWG